MKLHKKRAIIRASIFNVCIGLIVGSVFLLKFLLPSGLAFFILRATVALFFGYFLGRIAAYLECKLIN